MNSLYAASMGMINQQMNVDVISNNLANINTPGFKKSELNFKDFYYHDMGMGGNINLMVGQGSKVAGVSRIHSQGTLTESTNPLDLAIEGEGFFQIQLPDGTVGYTRDGSFRLDGEGNVVTVEGYFLQPPIHIGGQYSDIMVDNAGNVSIMPLDGDQPQEVGQITLARFANPAGLQNISGSIYTQTAVSGVPVQAAGGDGAGIIRQGYREMANVNVIEEMVSLIAAQRAYEINSKAVRTADEMMGIRNNLR